VPREILVVAPLIALLLVLGIYPKPVLDIINPAVGNTMATIGQHDPAPIVRPGAAHLPGMAEGPRR
jgi:NADH-quinone oxidoreductase subunit M